MGNWWGWGGGSGSSRPQSSGNPGFVAILGCPDCSSKHVCFQFHLFSKSSSHFSSSDLMKIIRGFVMFEAKNCCNTFSKELPLIVIWKLDLVQNTAAAKLRMTLRGAHYTSSPTCTLAPLLPCGLKSVGPRRSEGLTWALGWNCYEVRLQIKDINNLKGQPPQNCLFSCGAERLLRILEGNRKLDESGLSSESASYPSQVGV